MIEIKIGKQGEGMDNISKYSGKFEKSFPDVQQARLIFAQYAKLFWKARKHKSHG